MRDLTPLLFLLLCLVFYCYSLPDGNTKSKNILWAVGLCIAIVIYLFRYELTETCKHFPLFFYIFICFCSFPLNGHLINSTYLFVKPIIVPILLLSLFGVKKIRISHLLKRIKVVFIMLIICLIMNEIFFLGKIHYLSGNNFNSLLGTIHIAYLEVFFLCFASSLNIPPENKLHLNKKLISKFTIVLFICGVTIALAIKLLCFRFHIIVNTREFLAVLTPYWFLLSITCCRIILRFTKKDFPGDILSGKLFFDNEDIAFAHSQFQKYINIEKQIQYINKNFERTDDDSRILLEEELEDLLEYKDYLQKHTVIISNKDEE